MRSTKGNKIKISYIIHTIIVLVMLTSFSPICVSALDSDKPDTLVLLGNEDLAPIVYNDNGTAKGVAVDIAKAIGDNIGYDVKVLAVNWEQAQMMVLNGEADGLLQINPSPEREKVYDFSMHLLKSDFSIFTQEDNTTSRSIDDLRGKRVGVEAGGYPMTLLQKYEEIEIETIYDWETSFNNLSVGELDAIIVDRWIGEYKLAQSRIAGIKIIEDPIESQYSRIAVRKGDAETLSLINAGLKEITEDGTVDKIMERWQGKKVIYLTEEHFRNIFLHLFILFLAAILLVSIYFLTKYRKLSKNLEASVRERTEELHYSNERLRAANFILERISMMDGLTSIQNRRSFNISYNKAWELCQREGMPLALIMIDIDHFKIFNDTYGHLSGDQALIRIAEVLKGIIIRPGDLAARYGGEEFVVMLMNNTAEEAALVAEEIRKRVEELGIENQGLKSVVTISLGVASTIPNNMIEDEELIANADKALYKAKEEGRNRVIVWNDQRLNG